MTHEDFLDDPRTQDAASKCAEAIGLAANELQKLAPSIESEFPGLQLGLAYKACNKLSHGYYATDESVLWNTVSISIPKTVAAAREANRKYGRSGDPPM